MDKVLEDMKKELERLEDVRDEACWNYSQFNSEVVEYRLNNGLYHPMSKLISYACKDIDWITMVIKDRDGTLETLTLNKDIDGDIAFYIDVNGHIFCSSDSNGIIQYDDYTNRYIYTYGGSIDYYDFVGFMELSFELYERIDDIW